MISAQSVPELDWLRVRLFELSHQWFDDKRRYYVRSRSDSWWHLLDAVDPDERIASLVAATVQLTRYGRLSEERIAQMDRAELELYLRALSELMSKETLALSAEAT